MKIEIGTLEIALVVVMLLAGMWTVMAARLLRSVIGLAIVSVALTAIMYRMNAPLAAAFELSVCAGLVSAIFLSVIGLTVHMNPQQQNEQSKERFQRYWILPLVMVLAGVLLSRLNVLSPIIPQASTTDDVRQILWDHRHMDLLGQIIVLLGGTVGVVILFKEWKHEHE